MMIEARDIWKIYEVGDQKIEALRSIRLNVEKGSFVSIVGHSGSGKTTLLSIIGGLTKPSSGVVSLDGIDVWSLNDSSLSALRNEKIGFIFQFASLIPTLRVIDNVSLPVIFEKRMNGKGRKKVYAHAKELLATLGMSHKLNAYPSELSGGQQRRVSIARAFINKPDLIVADEPTGDLDTQNESEVMEFFSRINEQERTTFLLVTHNLDLAGMTDKVYHMKDGTLFAAERGGGSA